MEAVLLVIHLVLALAIIGLVLLQRSEGGGLGIGSSGGMGALASAHTAANLLTRATAVCAGGFFITSLMLGALAGAHSKGGSILDAATPLPITAPVKMDGDSGAATDKADKDNKAKSETPAKQPTAPVSR